MLTATAVTLKSDDVECFHSAHFIPSSMESTTMHQDTILRLGDVTFRSASIPTADTSLYSLSSDEAAFFKTQIGIDNDEDLKRHILEVQAKAYKASHSNRTSPTSHI